MKCCPDLGAHAQIDIQTTEQHTSIWKRGHMNRREFLQTGAGALSAMLVLNPRTVFGSEPNSAVRVGLLGCGNRGARAVRRKRRRRTRTLDRSLLLARTPGLGRIRSRLRRAPATLPPMVHFSTTSSSRIAIKSEHSSTASFPVRLTTRSPKESTQH